MLATMSLALPLTCMTPKPPTTHESMLVTSAFPDPAKTDGHEDGLCTSHACNQEDGAYTCQACI